MKNTLFTFIILTSFFRITFAQNLDSLIQIANSSEEKSTIYNEIVTYYLQQSELKLAKNYIDSVFIYSKKEGLEKQKGKAYLNLGDYYYYSSLYDSSIVNYKLSLRIFIKLNDVENSANAYSNLGSVYFTKSDYNLAIKYFVKAADSQKNTNKPEETAVIYNNIATVYYYIDNYSEAIKYYNLSLEIKKKFKAYKSIAMSLNNIANVYEIIGENEKAINFYFEAIEYCDKTNDKVLKAITYNNIAGVYKNWEQYSKALELYNNALDIKTELKDLNGVANILNNIGLVYKLKLELEVSEKYLIKAKDIFKNIGNKRRLAITYSNIGNVKMLQQDFEESIKWFNMSAILNDSINSPQGLALDYLNLANVYLSINNTIEASKYSKKCLNLINKSKLHSIKLDFYKLQSKLYKTKGDFEKAYIYYLKYSNIKDSVFSKEKHEKLNDLSIKYETEKKNHRIEILNTRNKSQLNEIKARRLERNLWIGISILAVFLGSISVYFFLNKKKLSEKLSQKNELIEKTLGEKDVLLREIHHRVKNNLQIISSLLNMQSRFLNDDKSKEIVAESQNRIKSMSLIHQKLYQETNLTGIETESYFTELIDSLCLSYGISKDKTNISIENLLLDVDTAIPMGLILNEMISNAFKYGVKRESGRFTFLFKKTSDKELFVMVKDNGLGIPKDFDIKKSKSYGMKLIQSLSKKLKADVNFENNEGLEITMKVRKFKITS